VVERVLKYVALPVGLTATLLMFFSGRLAIPGVVAVLFFSLASSLFFAWLIHFASLGFGGRIGALLELRPVTYIGKISYGIYVYHPFIAYSMNFLIYKLTGASSHTIALVSPVLCVPVVLFVAAKSWAWMEKPINDFKSRFSDDTQDSVGAAVTT
jgi:peptidoglycan/LPS O-acetylase OafA/YrhL